MMEDYKKIKSQLDCARIIKKSYEEGLKEHSTNSRCDKFGFGFNKDGRFSSTKITISIDSWKGYYGNSNCSSFIRITDKELFNKAFIRILQRNFKRLLFDAANLIEEEAIEQKEKAIADLNAALEEMQAVQMIGGE